jgi:hypothetical protein
MWFLAESVITGWADASSKHTLAERVSYRLIHPSRRGDRRTQPTATSAWELDCHVSLTTTSQVDRHLGLSVSARKALLLPLPSGTERARGLAWFGKRPSPLLPQWACAQLPRQVEQRGSRREEKSARAARAARQKTVAAAHALQSMTDEELISAAEARTSLSHPYHEIEMQRRLKDSIDALPSGNTPGSLVGVLGHSRHRPIDGGAHRANACPVRSAAC